MAKTSVFFFFFSEKYSIVKQRTRTFRHSHAFSSLRLAKVIKFRIGRRTRGKTPFPENRIPFFGRPSDDARAEPGGILIAKRYRAPSSRVELARGAHVIGSFSPPRVLAGLWRTSFKFARLPYKSPAGPVYRESRQTRSDWVVPPPYPENPAVPVRRAALETTRVFLFADRRRRPYVTKIENPSRPAGDVTGYVLPRFVRWAVPPLQTFCPQNSDDRAAQSRSQTLCGAKRANKLKNWYFFDTF